MTFVSIPLALAVLILTILALSFAWSFRLAHKLDKAYDDYDRVWELFMEAIKESDNKHHKDI